MLQNYWPNEKWLRFFGAPEDSSLESFLPRYTMYENENELIIEAPLPGLTEEQISITLDKNILRIHGKAEEEKQDKKHRIYQKVSLTRSFNIELPTHIDDKVEPTASLQNGILELHFAKVSQAQTKKIPIGNGKKKKA